MLPKLLQFLGVGFCVISVLMAADQAQASFATSQFAATYISFADEEQQGMPLDFMSTHSGKISHYRAGVWENCQIRAVVGYTDPPGHNPPMEPIHIVKEDFTYGTFPPYTDGEISMGIPTLKTLADVAAVDWTCSVNGAYHYLGWAKTNYSLNGGAQVNGAYDDQMFHSY